jgi:hypothetical protein
MLSPDGDSMQFGHVRPTGSCMINAQAWRKA